MTPMGDAYLRAAEAALALLREPVVAREWEQPSALAELTVGALAVHLARSVIRVPEVLTGEAPDGERPCSVLEHYARSDWVDGGLDHESNVGIRRRSQENAAAGAADVVAETEAALAEVRRTLPAQPEDRAVRPPWLTWSLTVPDFLLTRMVEIAVHCDDLAVSVAVPTPTLPPAVLDPVLDVLLRVATRRHGPTAVLRALSRTERAPATISAF